MKANTYTTRWAMRKGLGKVGVLYYNAQEYGYHYSEYFGQSIRNSFATNTVEKILWIWDDCGALKINAGGCGAMVNFVPGMEFEGIKINSITKKQKPMGSGIAYIGLYDEYFEVEYDIIPAAKPED